MATTKATTDTEYAAGLVHAVLASLEGMRQGVAMDPAHAERLDAAEEACRLVADAACESPRSLRPAPVSGLRGLVLRLAVETSDPAAAIGAFGGDENLGGLEAMHGSRAAALMGMAMALDALMSALGHRSQASLHDAPGGLLWIPRQAARRWALSVDGALARLEREVLRANVAPALRRDAWSVACLVSIASAHVTDHACVDAKSALARIAEAGSAVSQAVALDASQSAAGAGPAAAGACLALVKVLDEGFGLLREGIAVRDDNAALVAWRLAARGRTGLDKGRIRSLASVTGLAEAAGPARVEAAALSYEDEWRAA